MPLDNASEAFEVRRARPEDLPRILALYAQFGKGDGDTVTPRAKETWDFILADPDQTVIAGCLHGLIVSTCTLTVVHNLTHGYRPYAWIENVVTDAPYRGRGYASQVLKYAKELAAGQNCYKVMLMTGSKEEATLSFYERAGFNRRDKTAFITWLD